MFVGHYSASLVAKAVDPRIPLGVLFVAAQIVDIAWAIFVMTGIEDTRLVPGFTATNDFVLTYVPYTHSLAATVVWAAAFGVLWGVWRNGRGRVGAALLVGAVVLSHWFLDLVVHTPDLPLYGTQHKQGLGLWNHAHLSLALEAALLLGALFLYYRATRPVERGGRWQMLILAAGMLAMQCTALFGTRPETMAETAGAALGAYLVFALLAEWFDRKRVGRAR